MGFMRWVGLWWWIFGDGEFAVENGFEVLLVGGGLELGRELEIVLMGMKGRCRFMFVMLFHK